MLGGCARGRRRARARRRLRGRARPRRADLEDFFTKAPTTGLPRQAQRRDRERDRRDDRDRRARDADRAADRDPRRDLHERVRAAAGAPTSLSFVLDILNGLPSIVIGIFIFGLIVLAHQQSAFAGGIALAIIMLPLIARSTQEVLALVPESLREASFALGVSRWRTVARRDPPDELRRHPHRRRRSRSRARPARPRRSSSRARSTTTQISWDPAAAAAVDPADDLRGPRAARSRAPRAGVGGGARALAFVLVVSVLSKAVLARSRRKLSTTNEARIRSPPWLRSRSPSARARPTTRSRDGLRHPRPLGVLRRAHRRSSDVNLEIYRNMVTALIGPSGCGKSTFIRCAQPHERPRSRARGSRARSSTTARTSTAPVSIRSRCAAGSGWSSRSRTRSRSRSTTTSPGARACSACARALDERVERALDAGRALGRGEGPPEAERARRSPGGQQQRLCIARALAVEPEVLLLDEPASALDPIATSSIEDLMHELKRDYTIVIVTHNMQQAARVADMTAFFSLDVHEDGSRNGHPRRVRRDAEDLHPARRLADGGLRHRDASDEGLVPGGARRTEATLQEEGELVLRALRGALNALWEQDTRARGRGDRVRRRDRRDLRRHPARHRGAARAADAGRGRPAARARAAALEPPPRAHGRLLRDDREARSKLVAGCRARARARRRVRGHGRAGRGDDPRRARLFRGARRRSRRARSSSSTS